MRYRVCGKRETLGHAPGEEFEMDLDLITEVRLIAGNHIERVEETATPNRVEEIVTPNTLSATSPWAISGSGTHNVHDEA